MPDRGKVIDELVEHIESALAVDSDYVDCVRTDLLQTVVGMLKAQEPVKAYRLHGEKVIDNGEKVFAGYCDNCFCYLVDGWKACPACGKAVMWDA